MTTPILIAPTLLAWMLIALVSTFGVDLYRRRVARKLATPPGEGIAVIIPVKGVPGAEPALEAFLATCLAQRGASCRLVFAVQSENDPAAEPIRRLVARDERTSLVVAGRAAHRGQKIHNQLAALATLRPDDRIVVFADADVILAKDWLAQLIRPLLVGHAQIASGYRWILPDDSHPASRACALMDWGIATAPRSKSWNLCWGGSMALTRAALDRLDLPRLWDRSLLDDIVLTNAARRLGIAVHAPHQVLVPSPARHDWRSLFAFGRRQYLFVRVHAPGHWILAGFVLAIPLVGAGLALWEAAQGNPTAIAILFVAVGLQQTRASLRTEIARRVLPPAQAAQSKAVIRRDRWALPAIHLLHCAIWLTSAIGSTMVWGGTRYRLLGPARCEIVSLDATKRRGGWSGRRESNPPS